MTPSSVKRLPNVCGGIVLENGNGHQPKPSPALPSSATDGKKSDQSRKLDHFRNDVIKIKHFPIAEIKKAERNHDDSGSESSAAHGEGRRISIRQTELAYRFKEIVVRKMHGYMHVSLVSHTRGKNAVNPKVWWSHRRIIMFLFLLAGSCRISSQSDLERWSLSLFLKSVSPTKKKNMNNKI